MLTWYELTRQEDKLILFLKMGSGGQRTEFGGRGWSLLTDEEPHPLAPAKQQVSKAGAAHFRPLWGVLSRISLSKELLTDHPAPSCPADHAVTGWGHNSRLSREEGQGFKLSSKRRIWIERPPCLQTLCSGEKQTENRGCDKSKALGPASPVSQQSPAPTPGWGPIGPTQSGHTGPAGWGRQSRAWQ